MKVKATSQGRKSDLRDRCGRMILTADGDDEAEFLSAVYRAIIGVGGRSFLSVSVGGDVIEWEPATGLIRPKTGAAAVKARGEQTGEVLP